jgi:hypothetical protein
MTKKKEGKGQIRKITFLRSIEKLKFALARAIEDKGHSMTDVAKIAKHGNRYIDPPMISRYLSGSNHGIGDENLYWLCCKYGITVTTKVGRTNSSKMRTDGVADMMTARIFKPEDTDGTVE